MSKIDWSKITPAVAVWCQTEEEDIAFRRECEERGIRWGAGFRASEVTLFNQTTGYKYAVMGRFLYGTLDPTHCIPYSNLMVEDKPAKSRLAEILGVEDDEEWEYDGRAYRIHEGGRQIWLDNSYWRGAVQESVLVEIINNHKSIIRKPRFNVDEMGMLRCFAAAGVTHIARDNVQWSRGVFGYECEPIKSAAGEFDYPSGGDLYRLPDGALPSLRPGDSVELSEVLK